MIFRPNKTSFKPINEAYFVENKNIEKMQELISKIRKESNAMSIKKINTNPSVLEFNRLVEKEFGFATFCLYISPSRYYNACTYPVSSKIDITDQNKKIKRKKDGFYYDDNNYSVITYISSSMILDNRFTDREIFAVILHEIGHSFTGAIPGMGAFTAIQKALLAAYVIELLVVSIIVSTVNPLLGVLTAAMFVSTLQVTVNKIHKPIIEYIENRRKNDKELEEAITQINNIVDAFTYGLNETFMAIGFISSITNPFGVLISTIERFFNTVLRTIVDGSIFSIFLGYNQEKISDNFPTMYGYGPEIGSALLKLNTGGSTVIEFMQDTVILKIMNDMLMLPSQILFAPFHVHPENSARLNDQIKYLKKELEHGNIDPKMKAKIESEIVSLQTLIDNNFKSIKVKMKDGSVDPDFVSKIYPTVMYTICGGDIRELIMGKKHWENIEKIK